MVFLLKSSIFVATYTQLAYEVGVGRNPRLCPAMTSAGLLSCLGVSY